MIINYKLKNWTILKAEVRRLLLSASPTETTWLLQAQRKLESNIQQAKERREKVSIHYTLQSKVGFPKFDDKSPCPLGGGCPT